MSLSYTQIGLLIGAGLMLLSAVAPKAVSFVKGLLPAKGGADSPPDFRRGIDGLEVLVDELKKVGVSDAELSSWRRDAIEALLKAAK